MSTLTPPPLIGEIADEVAALARDDGGAGQYATDGLGLYRMLGPLEAPGVSDEIVALEDCLTLELVLISRETLASWGLRPIGPAS